MHVLWQKRSQIRRLPIQEFGYENHFSNTKLNISNDSQKRNINNFSKKSNERFNLSKNPTKSTHGFTDFSIKGKIMKPESEEGILDMSLLLENSVNEFNDSPVYTNVDNNIQTNSV